MVTGGRRWLILDEHEGAKLPKKKVWWTSLIFLEKNIGNSWRQTKNHSLHSFRSWNNHRFTK
jgi:hypothetical protein